MTDGLAAAPAADVTELQIRAGEWFRELRNRICEALETIEDELSDSPLPVGRFERTSWQRPTGGGGEMSLLREGRVFEKGGVNISTVFGEFSEAFRKEIPGADQDPRFWASGISLVIHPRSPMVPIVHMNTRMIVVGDPRNPARAWFGGGADLTPVFAQANDTRDFHAAMRAACEGHDAGYYEKFSAWCDEYFYNKHRKEIRGVGGIFYDYLDSGNREADFSFTRDVGMAFHAIYPQIVRRHYRETYGEAEKRAQLIKRGRYAEFNLVYDRGTRFGLMTDGNVDAILMSLPPMAMWP